MENNSAVLVYGAYGHTGRFIIAEALRRGLHPIASGRNPIALAAVAADFPGLEVRVASIDSAPELDAAASGTAVVINAAGPFLDTSLPLASAAVRAGAHYLDVSAEQGSVQSLYEAFGSSGRITDTAVVPAMSFYGGLADLLVTAVAGEWENLDAVTVAIGLDRWWPTPGTRITGARNTATRLRVSDSRLVPVPEEPGRRVWNFPEPIGQQVVREQPFSEMIAMSKHLHAHRIDNLLSEAALIDIGDPNTGTPPSIDEYGRSAQNFTVDVRLERAGRHRGTRVSGHDIYHVTAPLVVEAAVRLIGGRHTGAGALAPGEAFDAADFLTALSTDWLRVESPAAPIA
ncbi:saccharopine dehydrogenase family protein [Brevibacterium spongiae]|uniref:Saccharopine dehydrogenase NADP-binding domain-containing protein n=1 Tax=Brevibacterium spongiae TaxID=2909672 RepID=A0ABY5SR03_9MICO|nr:saccharopine dehydrogenase NADP-binding domain-containing protein [Brevibacterium spongiae]UVI36988.1 saccharopine dehydrogenase NADP-binding domain-containing protein [Brevibacterium spongiae]